MPKQHKYTLTENELIALQDAMRNLDSRVSKRATVVHSLHLGYSPQQVADIHRLSLVTIYNYFNRFKSNGVDGLPDKAKSGRPSKATDEYITLLEQTLETDPKQKGYAFTIWTQARLRCYLSQKTGIELSRSRFHDLMHRLGYRYRRPKRDLGHKQDPELREQVKDALESLKKKAAAGEIELLFMDEATIGLIYPLLKCWMKVGEQTLIPMTTGKRRYQYLAGALNWRTEAIHCRSLERMNSESIIAYFEWLFTEVYPTQTLVLVMDNASFHHSYAMQAALSVFEDRLLIVWLPPYSPDLNPIERFWKHLKANACANKLYQSIKQLILGVFEMIDCQNQPDHELRLTFSKDF